MAVKTILSWLMSRKVKMVLVGMGMLLLGAILAAFVPVFEPAYATYVGGVLTLVAIYCGGNVSQKFVEARRDAPPLPEEHPEESDSVR